MNRRLFESIARKHSCKFWRQTLSENEDDQRYFDERKQAQDSTINTAEQLDKSLLVLSSSAIGLSVTFLEKFQDHLKNEDGLYLKLAWVFFSLTILMVILSFWFSKFAFEKHVVLYEKKNRSEIVGWNYWNFFTNLVNGFASSFFLVGVFMYARFAWNLF